MFGLTLTITIVGDNILEGVEQLFDCLERSDPDVTSMPSTTTIQVQDSGGKLYSYFSPSILVCEFAAAVDIYTTAKTFNSLTASDEGSLYVVYKYNI